jgi:hypothetical protein
MNPIKAFINWLLKHPCATPGCNTLISRWVGADEVVMVGDDEKILYEQDGVFCPTCRQQQSTGRDWIGGDLDF